MAKTKTPKKAEPKTRPRKTDNPDQYRRFRDFAREHEVDEREEAFDKIFRKVLGNKPV